MAYTRKGKRAGEIAYACLACQKSYKDKNTQKVRATAKVYRSTHADQRRQNFVRWRQNNRERSNELSHGWAQRNPERMALSRKVAQVVYRATRDGRLTRPEQCEQCGNNGRIEAAHTDYSRPLDVRWLCVSCHRKWDAQQPKTLVAVQPPES